MFIETARKFGFGDSVEVENTNKESDIVRIVNMIVENEKKLRYLETDTETKLYREENEKLFAIHANICAINKMIDDMDLRQDEKPSPYIMDCEDQPKLFELLKKVLEFTKIYPELMCFLDNSEAISALLEELLGDTE